MLSQKSKSTITIYPLRGFNFRFILSALCLNKCKENNIEASILKTKMMVFRNKKSPRPYNKVSLTLNGEAVEEVESYKALGTTIDNQLNFEKHFERVVKKWVLCSEPNQKIQHCTKIYHRKKHW